MTPPSNPADPKRKAVKTVGRVALVTAAIAIAIVVHGMMTRMQASADQATAAVEQSIPSVGVIHPVAGAGANALTLPGNLQAYYSAAIYARVPGYLTKWYKDIGARVHKGELLADIDTPELDQQIAQARADVANAEAGRQLSDTTNQRWEHLVAIGAVAKQDADNKAGDLAVKTAAEGSAKANLDRLMATKEFARITAPFDGIVTQRTTDIGALVNVGAGAGGSLLFTVADLHKIRVYVQVPQNYSARIQGNLTADLTLPEYPGEKFVARLVSTSNAIDGQTNTLLVQLEADNQAGKLKPGEYAEVRFRLPPDSGMLSIPASALLFRADGLRVATVGDGNRVVLKTVTVSEDLGATVRVNAGLDASDLVIDNPPDSITTGDVVHVSAPPAATVAARGS